VALLCGDVAGPVNIASGKAVPVRELVNLIAEQAGGLERVRFGALTGRADEPAVIAGSSRRLNEEVGFEPAISLEQGIAETVSWWRAHI
jgi:nucleoside-diphosphate-sugar epimerase